MPAFHPNSSSSRGVSHTHRYSTHHRATRRALSKPRKSLPVGDILDPTSRVLLINLKRKGYCKARGGPNRSTCLRLSGDDGMMAGELYTGDSTSAVQRTEMSNGQPVEPRSLVTCAVAVSSSMLVKANALRLSAETIWILRRRRVLILCGRGERVPT